MNKEEKLLKLLRIATENGWKPTKDLLNDVKKIVVSDNSIHNNIVIIGLDNKRYYNELSLNDLVTNWEEGEVSFIEALCTAISLTDVNALSVLSTLNISLATERMRQRWVVQPTSKRLDWLFETFKHLLQ